MHRRLAQASEAIAIATRDLTIDDLIRLPPGRWSGAQILEHLTLSYQLNARGFEAVVRTRRPRATPATLAQRTARVVVLGLGYFPRVQAPEPTRPSNEIPPGDVRDAARAALEDLDVSMDAAVAALGDRVPMLNHPFFGGLNVRQWRTFHWRHTLHHLRQIRAVSRG